jgi:hypothetical protein
MFDEAFTPREVSGANLHQLTPDFTRSDSRYGAQRLFSPDARFQSLSEPWADTTTHAGKMSMTVLDGIAEFERDLQPEREIRCT